MEAGGAHASSDQAKPAGGAWTNDSKDASVRAPAAVESSTPRDGVEQAATSTPVRNKASLEIELETPGKDEAPPQSTNAEALPKPGKLPALEVGDSLAGGSSPAPSAGKTKLGKLKPMPPPVAHPENASAVTLPNAMPSPVPDGKAQGSSNL